jgi:hypothetical protein
VHFSHAFDSVPEQCGMSACADVLVCCIVVFPRIQFKCVRVPWSEEQLYDSIAIF